MYFHLKGWCVFLPPAPCSCNLLSSPPVVAFPLAKSYWSGSKLTLKKIVFSYLTWEGSCLLTSSGQIGHRRLYHQISVEQGARELSVQITSLTLICFPKSSNEKIGNIFSVRFHQSNTLKEKVSKWRLVELQNEVLWSQEVSH